MSVHLYQFEVPELPDNQGWAAMPGQTGQACRCLLPHPHSPMRCRIPHGQGGCARGLLPTALRAAQRIASHPPIKVAAHMRTSCPPTYSGERNAQSKGKSA